MRSLRCYPRHRQADGTCDLSGSPLPRHSLTFSVCRARRSRTRRWWIPIGHPILSYVRLEPGRRLLCDHSLPRNSSPPPSLLITIEANLEKLLTPFNPAVSMFTTRVSVKKCFRDFSNISILDESIDDICDDNRDIQGYLFTF